MHRGAVNIVQPNPTLKASLQGAKSNWKSFVIRNMRCCSLKQYNPNIVNHFNEIVCVLSQCIEQNASLNKRQFVWYLIIEFKQASLNELNILMLPEGYICSAYVYHAGTYTIHMYVVASFHSTTTITPRRHCTSDENI